MRSIGGGRDNHELWRTRIFSHQCRYCLRDCILEDPKSLLSVKLLQQRLRLSATRRAATQNTSNISSSSRPSNSNHSQPRHLITYEFRANTSGYPLGQSLALTTLYDYELLQLPILRSFGASPPPPFTVSLNITLNSRLLQPSGLFSNQPTRPPPR